MDRDSLSILSRQRGLTLVELLIGLFLQSLVLLILAQLYLSGGSTFRMQQETGKLQSRGHYAAGIMATDLRTAGFTGCRNLDELSPRIMADGVDDFAGMADAVSVYENGSGWSAPAGYTRLDGTDVLQVIYGATGAYLTGNVDPSNANIQIKGMTDHFSADDLVLISDCQAADLFRATNVSSASGVVTIAHSQPKNNDNKLSKNYRENTQVFKLIHVNYFVATDGNDQGLYRQEGEAPPVLIAAGVEAFRVQILEDAGGTPVGGRYALVLATDQQVADSAIPFSFDGDDLNTADGDRKVRRLFSGYYSLRNFGS